jgi:ribose 5-phosphate isomerase B
MKIFIGSDHRGFALKSEIVAWLSKNGYDVTDMGPESYVPTDGFPTYAGKVALAVVGADEAETPRGILICGSGEGMAMAANRFRGIRAGVGWSREAAKDMREHNDANILTLSADALAGDAEKWQSIVDAFLMGEFTGEEKRVRRNNMIDELG